MGRSCRTQVSSGGHSTRGSWTHSSISPPAWLANPIAPPSFCCCFYSALSTISQLRSQGNLGGPANHHSGLDRTLEPDQSPMASPTCKEEPEAESMAHALTSLSDACLTTSAVKDKQSWTPKWSGLTLISVILTRYERGQCELNLTLIHTQVTGSVKGRMRGQGGGLSRVRDVKLQKT